MDASLRLPEIRQRAVLHCSIVQSLWQSAVDVELRGRAGMMGWLAA